MSLPHPAPPHPDLKQVEASLADMDAGRFQDVREILKESQQMAEQPGEGKKCKACGGSGSVPVSKEPCSTDLTDCRVCDGTGNAVSTEQSGREKPVQEHPSHWTIYGNGCGGWYAWNGHVNLRLGLIHNGTFTEAVEQFNLKIGDYYSSRIVTPTEQPGEQELCACGHTKAIHNFGEHCRECNCHGFRVVAPAAETARPKPGCGGDNLSDPEPKPKPAETVEKTIVTEKHREVARYIAQLLWGGEPKPSFCEIENVLAKEFPDQSASIATLLKELATANAQCQARGEDLSQAVKCLTKANGGT